MLKSSGGLKSKGGYWKQTKNATNGWKTTPTGNLTFRSSKYLSWLHENIRTGIVEIFIVPDIKNEGPIELHHLPNPQGNFSGSRRDLDCNVVPLFKSGHDQMENNPWFERLHMMNMRHIAMTNFFEYCTRNSPDGFNEPSSYMEVLLHGFVNKFENPDGASTDE